MTKLFLTSFVALLILAAAPAWALRCDGRLVNTGDHKIEVLAKCGEPVWQERWQDDVFERRFFDTLERRSVVVEEWIYDFGPHRLLYLLRFRNGRLTDITTGDRATMAVDACRDGRTLRVGDTKIEVIRKCGAPAYSDSREDELLRAVDPHRALRSTIRVDEWTYNFGPRRFLLHLIFENGRLRQIETGGYGF
ncbi:Protein of unknown function [Geoalkalibacter ferrihydriticus]|uniref:DUF2845 domain-containing protein n=1 Tax=Geoalkalibacter ferrihydriticus TaxID=392333 RepID=A0A1G9SHI7_9BACT|nr:DUF2845 domain-containing protein [Geoalkalibacter ferrihydriticus]SDM34899.1 Protein of unknown function [Geoalkalibacter ferrihydriticus]